MALPWSFVSKNTNSKHQITNKSQIPIFNDQKPFETKHCLDFRILVSQLRHSSHLATTAELGFV
jgi:hypothetical protein